MKTIVSALLLLLFASFCAAQSVLYFDFVSHNEETMQWNGTPYYTNNRTKIINLATDFQGKGITWNLQSDWVYLTNVLNQETAPLMATTNNKNVLRYLSEDLRVELDPHAHESSRIYPDVAHLMDSLGLLESKIMGGTIYDGENGINNWMNLQNGQNGVVYPWAFWQPEYIWGAATPNHANDPKYFGVWNPQDTSNFLVHNPAQPLRNLSTGCEMKIRDTTTVSTFISNIRDLITYVESGAYPVNGFYMQTIFFEQGSLNNNLFYNKVLEIADSINTLVLEGHGEWKTLKQMYMEWETTYGAQMFMWECGDLVGLEEEVLTDEWTLYPNPAGSMVVFSKELSDVVVYDVYGRMVIPRMDFAERVSVAGLANGIYYVQANEGSRRLVVGR